MMMDKKGRVKGTLSVCFLVCLSISLSSASPEYVRDSSGRLYLLDYPETERDVSYAYFSSGNSIAIYEDHSDNLLDTMAFYDANGNTLLQRPEVTVMIPNGNATMRRDIIFMDGFIMPVEYTYDDDTLSSVKSLDGTTSVSFDAPLGTIEEITNGAKIITRIEEDGRISKSFPSGLKVSYKEVGGRYETVADYGNFEVSSTSPEITNEYDAEGRLVRKSELGVDYSMTYTYYPNGLLKQTRYPNGEWERYRYDGMNRLVKIDYHYVNDENSPLLAILKFVMSGTDSAGTSGEVTFYTSRPDDIQSLFTAEELQGLGAERYKQNICGNLVIEPANGEECDTGEGGGYGCDTGCKRTSGNASMLSGDNQKVCYLDARSCVYLNAPTAVVANSSDALDLRQDYNGSEVFIKFSLTPPQDFNSTGAPAQKLPIMLGNSQDMKDAYVFQKQVSGSTRYALYSKWQNYRYQEVFLQVISDAPILENEVLMRTLTGREHVQLPPPVRQRQAEIQGTKKPEELQNNPLFIILIPILMIGIVASIASATRPKRRKVKIAVTIGLSAGVAILLLMLVNVPSSKAVTCSELEQTIVIAIDVSGSMSDKIIGGNESKFQVGKRAVSDLIKGFGNNTKYAILTFSLGQARLSYIDKTAGRDAAPIAIRTAQDAEDAANNQTYKLFFEKSDEEIVLKRKLPGSTGYGTSLQPALLGGLVLLKHSDTPLKRVIVLTDGQETLNITELAKNYELPIEIDAVLLLSDDYDSEYYDPPTILDIVEWSAGEVYEASDYAKVLESLRKAATVCG